MVASSRASLLSVLFSIVVCASAKDWWENGNFYQIYPRSFKDSNGDGIGDLKGITEKVPYLKEIGIDGVWLSPIFKSPMVDFGYDISDFRAIQPEYGTMADFERLAAACKKNGVRLILDFVPNHSSDQHEWFKRSVRREPGYENFYIWHPGKTNATTGERLPPNNWLSIFRFGAWEWNEQRKEYYLHQFTKEQPDLNYRNPAVVKEMTDVLRFWLGKGVSGFRVDAITSLFEVSADANGNYPDEPKSGACNDPFDHCYLNHIHTADQKETYDQVYQWREFLDDYKKQNGGDTRIMMSEAYSSLEKILLYYGNGVRNGSHIPFNFRLLVRTDKGNTAAKNYAEEIGSFLSKMPKDVQANWVLGNHDKDRIASRLGEMKVDLYNILLKTLPGISITYYGEEIGMTNTLISWNKTVDPPALNAGERNYHNFSRDFARTPFHWDSSKNAGFSNGKSTWLPLNVNYHNTNVKDQKIQPKSHLNIFKRLSQLRKEPAFANGTFEAAILDEDIYAYKRSGSNGRSFVVVLNLGEQWRTVNLSRQFRLPDNLQIILSSIESQYQDREIVNATKLAVPKNIGIILSN